jgi:signal transduction histidine kinase
VPIPETFTMRFPWRTTRRGLLAVMLLTAGAPAFAQQPATRPADSQPADGPGDAMDIEEPWDEPADPPVLTTAAAVRALSPAQAAARRPVKIRGVLAYASTVPPLLFIRDETGGVCVVASRDRESRGIRLGSIVEMEGVTESAGNIPYIVNVRREPLQLKVLGTARPAVPLPATLGQLNTPALHGEFVEVEAVVRSVRTEALGAASPNAAVITLAHGADRAEAVLFGRGVEAIVPEQLVGALVRARGVFNAVPVAWNGPATTRLLLRGARDVRVRQPAVAVKDLPILAIGALSDEAPPQAAVARTRVQGVVTLAIPGKGMFLQDNSGGAWVEAAPQDSRQPTTAPAEAAPGDRVDVVGFPGRRGWSTVLTDAAWQVTGRAPLPEAPLLTAARALHAAMDARLVRLEALVLSVSRPGGETTIVLQSGDRVFLARLVGAAADAPPPVSEGSWVRVTGVCMHSQIEAAAGWTRGVGPEVAAAEPLPGAQPTSFHLLLAAPDAVQVITAPGWWTLRRVLYVCAALAAVTLAAFAWVAALRRRVTRQTTQIHEHLAKRTLYEERVRIARDLHDSLEQDLLGITMQLNATEKLLARPEQAKQSLHLAAAMVRRSQAETHRAVWDLRERRPGQDGLVAALREAVAGLSTWRANAGGAAGGNGEGPHVEVRVTGQSHDLPAQVENHLLRMALEAVTNAVKHAAAKRIEVDLAFGPDEVVVRVSDDGRGFDAERLPPPSSGHFGLFGMRERAEKLNARLTIRSTPGEGTDIRLDVPLRANGAPAAAVRARLTEAAAE